MKIIVANLKMNKGLDEINEYLNNIKGQINTGLNVVICPSYIYLNLFKSNEFKLGAQNCFYKDEGSYTGEISVSQLKTMDVEYIIVGHSERIINFNETYDMVGEKVKLILNQNIKPIICVGETKIEKDMKKTSIVIKKQLLKALKYINKDTIEDIIIAYEPIWSVGTGTIPSINEIEEVTTYIKNIIGSEYNFNNIKILYGGSVNNSNVKDIINIESIEGILVGKISLEPLTFINLLDKII